MISTKVSIEMSVAEYAKQEGISRVAAYKRVKKGQVKHRKIGSLIIIVIEEGEANG